MHKIMKQPSFAVEFLGYIVLLTLVCCWLCFKAIHSFYGCKSSNQHDISDDYVLLENQEQSSREDGLNLQQPLSTNSQKKYSKSAFELIHAFSDLINSTVFILYIEHFTGYSEQSLVYFVCTTLCVIKLLLFICNIMDNMLILCFSVSDEFIFYFTITLDLISYHLSLIDGMFKLIYSFPTSWTMKPATFWNVTFSLSFACLNGVFLPIKYELKQISIDKDEMAKNLKLSCGDKCFVTGLLKAIQYSAKLIAFIPIFMGINTITVGLSVIMAVTQSSFYAIYYGFGWIFGVYIVSGFRKIKLNFFADLTIYILVVNLCEVIDVAIITATAWLYGHFNPPNKIPDDNYYFYTMAPWIFYIALFIGLYQFYPLIYALAIGRFHDLGTCCNVLIYALTFPIAIIIGLGIYVWPILCSIGIFCIIFNCGLWGGILERIIRRNCKEVIGLLLIIVLCVAAYFIISAAG
eukprot:188829_1